ncbi:MAG TPA: phosphoenolpyruvate--protein phosphotransferase [Steroidobacteraceae bacterium]|nr:phosphoenolpyruvate--protein phosphotransferase [Steroidobacteraceae bacterium]
MPLVTILSPFDGWCARLEEVPDPVFSGRMLGDGVAIDPVSGIVLAPCAGEVVTLPATAHAVTIRTLGGADVLVHIGIDTVQLGGRGFAAQVKLGQVVEAGQELIRFDLDTVARGAKTLLTPVVVAANDGLTIRHRRAAGIIKAGDVLFEIVQARDVVRSSEVTQTSDVAHSREVTPAPAPAQRTVTVQLRHGLHARPAALLAQAAKALAAEVSILAHGKTANARSITAVMALGVRHGEEVTFTASGSDAGRAIEQLSAALEAALHMESAAGHSTTGDRASAVGTAGATSSAMSSVAAAATSGVNSGGAVDGVLTGIAAVAGFAVGRATRIERREIVVEEQGGGMAYEGAQLEQARTNVRARLTRVGATGGVTRGQIAAAHVEFLDDPVVNEAAQELIAAGKSAGYAWRAATRRQVQALEALGDTRLRERADDLLDVESHVLLALMGEARPIKLTIPDDAVILAEDLLPSELTALDTARLVAICLGRGGATSHVAILAAAMDVPMLVGLGTGIHAVADGAMVIVDADAGTLHTAPDISALDAAHAAVATRLKNRSAERAAALADCRSLDGTRIEIFANLGSTADAVAAVANGAEGCGLLRTEFLFIDRDTAPDEREQRDAYQAISTALGARPLVLRLMDVGGDKPLKYLPLPHEENPALGLRGVRTALARPDLLRTQLRAALRVEPFGVVQLLIPMVTDVTEIIAVRTVIEELNTELGNRPKIKLGAMIETPAAALNASVLLREVDFLSIGSNDLTQYTLAMDRGHAALAGRTDALHPAVLKLIALTANAGIEAGKTVAVCGGVAADRIAVPVLLGLGIRELSVVPAAIPAIKRQIRAVRIADCRALASRCLELGTAAEVRWLVAQTSITFGDAP